VQTEEQELLGKHKGWPSKCCPGCMYGRRLPDRNKGVLLLQITDN